MNKSLAGILKIIFTVLIILVVIYVGVVLITTAYEFGYRVFTESAVDSGDGQDILIQIKEDMSDFEIGRELEEKGLVRDGNLFALQMKLSAYEGKLQPGVYTLNTSMTPKEMIVSIAQEYEEQEKAQKDGTEGTEKPAENAGADEGTAPVREEQ